MKKLAILILLSLFVLAGCQDDSSILAPNNDYASDEMSKGRPILGLDGISTFNATDDDIVSDNLDEADPDTIIKPILTTTVDEESGEEATK